MASNLHYIRFVWGVMMMWFKRAATAIAATAGLSAATLAFAPAALAYGPSYCNSSTCTLWGSPSPSYEIFEMPRFTPISMRCWTDNAWWDGTNRWFYVDTIYGRDWVNANQVSNQ